MTTFDISQFKGYSKADILEYLQLEEADEEILIILDKPADFDKYGAEQMAFDYYQAAYLGQELLKICENIGISYPEMKRPGKFSFRAIYPRLPELATLLHFYTEGMDEWGAPEDDYLDTVMNFFFEMDDKEIIACAEFLDIAMIAINGDDPEQNQCRYKDPR